ncbi:transferase hexapeptide (six repeat-containing protein) [Pseudobutyrivibrio sp. ACV-2]|uniref:CatB-related O-acetyltransferase n=1 Tax=Pseudobutyrivibrio sp. ACV-2 TaxID=1520801 RepID=UPI000896AA06|nr:CatB-related O-acetyltransferase [Pseudobutyrivibrio sp. ACV-2]SEA01891.1 transferase hexapeptide (six repeat-containing protein) [Pseudobutyrivibrio sp. ACV-2]
MKIFDTLFRYLRNKKIQKEGGQLYSGTLREYTEKNYRVSVGMYTYGSCFEKRFNLGGQAEIGRYCSVAADVHYLAANHPIDFITTSAIFFNKRFSHFEVKDVERHKLTVGNDVWIGSRVIITSSCSKIGNGAIIGAGSVVTHDVEPYTIVAGNPAKLIRKRFTDEQIQEIENSKWWDYTPQELMKYYPDMADISSFCYKIQQISKE